MEILEALVKNNVMAGNNATAGAYLKEIIRTSKTDAATIITYALDAAEFKGRHCDRNPERVRDAIRETVKVIDINHPFSSPKKIDDKLEKPVPCAICGCVGYHQNCGTV